MRLPAVVLAGALFVSASGAAMAQTPPAPPSLPTPSSAAPAPPAPPSLPTVAATTVAPPAPPSLPTVAATRVAPPAPPSLPTAAATAVRPIATARPVVRPTVIATRPAVQAPVTKAVSQAPVKGPISQAPAKGPVAVQAPSKAAAAPVAVAPVAAAPVAAAPQLPNTGTGGLLPQSQNSIPEAGVLASILGLIGLGGLSVAFRRRHSA